MQIATLQYDSPVHPVRYVRVIYEFQLKVHLWLFQVPPVYRKPNIKLNGIDLTTNYEDELRSIYTIFGNIKYI